MKRRILFLSALLALVTGAIVLPLVASAVSWSSSVTLGSGSIRPAAALDSDSHLHAVWWETAHKSIRYTECDDLASSDCDTPSTLPNTGKSAYPRIAIDTQGRPNVVWQSKKGKTNVIYWSRLEGGQWSTPIKISDKGNNTYPDIAIGLQGNIHIVFQSRIKKKTYIRYAHSSDGTRFSNSVTLDSLDLTAHAIAASKGKDETATLSKGLNARVAADSQDRAHVVWNAPAPFGVFYTYQNSANHFVNRIAVATKDKDQMPALAIGSDDMVAIVWISKEKSTIGIAQFQNGVRTYWGLGLSLNLQTTTNPAIAGDCWGNFQVVFQGQEQGIKKSQIYHRSFDPAAHAFDEQERLSNAQQQLLTPAVAAAGNGAVVFANNSSGTIEASAATFIPDCNSPPAPTPTFTPVAGDEHLSEDDPRITYTGTWAINPDSKASDDSYARCGGIQKCAKDASAELSFVGGTRVEWETAAAKSFGRAQVRVDGQLFELIDFCKLHSNSNQLKFSKRTYVLSGDANTSHTLKITALGDHSNCSPKNTNYIVVDGFNIIR